MIGACVLRCAFIHNSRAGEDWKMPKPNVKSAIIKLSGRVNNSTEQALDLDVDGLNQNARITIFGVGSDNQAYVWQGQWQSNSGRKNTFKVYCKYGYSTVDPNFGASDVIDVTITVQNPGQGGGAPESSPPFQSVVEIS
jgi:hypothetical protein